MKLRSSGFFFQEEITHDLIGMIQVSDALIGQCIQCIHRDNRTRDSATI